MSESDAKQTGGKDSKPGESGMGFASDEILDFAASQMTEKSEEPVSELDTLRGQLQDAENRALRYQADLDNFRRRTRREMDEQMKYASLSLINGILDSLDNLERALSSIPQEQADSGLAQGVRMVAHQIHDTLRAAGCQKIDAVGQPFDPKLHQAVQTQVNDAVPPNEVLHELRTGYQLYERVVRPSQVIVSAGPG
ncbi:MAG: nucleotide exchange factor GrpE [Planctomycetota bacterium]